MKKWNLYGWIAAVASPGSPVRNRAPDKATAAIQP